MYPSHPQPWPAQRPGHWPPPRPDYAGPQQPTPPGRHYPTPPQQHYGYPPHLAPPRHEPVFNVEVAKHTGLLIMWMQQTVKVRGTYQQCEAALREAQRHCLLAGWWSPLSLFIFNPIALGTNYFERRNLRRRASHAVATAVHPPGGGHPEAAAHPGWPSHR